ncbi:MAG TPA: 7-cyano-7-deazaguanine synthase QueC [Myxococcota bacterium]|nr:7-cyano-7-deazaguanine synthase QueC [Myxococcota bacterium]
MKSTNKRAVVLLSGGMDSTTCLAIATSEGYDCYSMAFDYGQRHAIELEKAGLQARAFGVRRHMVIGVELSKIGGSALTTEIAVPKEPPAGDIPVTYVPARNTVFLSLGLAWAETLGARDIFIGANQVDYSGYPDCRDEFISAYQRMANLATRMGMRGESISIRTPLLNLDKAAIIRRGLELGVNYINTHTCYDPTPGGLACGLCPSCRLRLAGFAAAGCKDPVAYA